MRLFDAASVTQHQRIVIQVTLPVMGKAHAYIIKESAAKSNALFIHSMPGIVINVYFL
jgi:ATP sulfurylase